MKRAATTVLLVALCHLGLASAAEPAKLSFDTYSGYFVSNKFEPDAAESFVVITSRQQFDKVFGVAFVMGDKSHRLPKDAFKSNIVLAAIKRGKAVWEYKVAGVTVDNGLVNLRYTATSKKSDTATFACPLIVSIPKGDYAAIQFWDGGKAVKKVKGSIATADRPDHTTPWEMSGALKTSHLWARLKTSHPEKEGVCR